MLGKYKDMGVSLTIELNPYYWALGKCIEIDKLEIYILIEFGPFSFIIDWDEGDFC